MSGTHTLGLIAALVATAGALALAVRFLGRMNGTLTGRAGALPMKVLQRVSIGPRQGVALLQVGERVLVVSLTDAGMSLLTELEEEATAAVLTPAASPARRPAFVLPWIGALLLGALVFGAPRADAQGAPAKAAPARPSVTTPVATATPRPALPFSTPVATGSPSPAPSKAAAAGHAVPGFHVDGPASPKVDIRIGDDKGGVHLEGAVGLVVFLGFMTLLPALFLLMTSFTRILIVLHFLRSALGTQTVPPSQLLVALAVLLTGVVMNPVLQETQRVAIQPYLDGQISQGDAYKLALGPFRTFMLNNTRDKDLAMFTQLSNAQDVDRVEDLPIATVVAAFVTSELRTSFQMGFVIFLPFVVVDVVVASVLMSLGMFMLPPVMISLPLKLLLFVLADGWTLVVQSLVQSFRQG